MERIKMEREKSDFSFKAFINSPYAIVVVLIVFSLALLAYSRYLIRANVLYTFSGYSEDFSFLGGTIYESPLINYFGDSKVLYTGDDMRLTEFEVGYYIKDGDDYISISVTKGYDMGEDEESGKKDKDDKKDTKKGASLKDVLMGTGFSFTETHKDAVFFSEDNLKKLDNLVFRVSGKDQKGKQVEIEVPMIVEKVTK